MRVTYEFKRRLTYFEAEYEKRSNSFEGILLAIDKRISDLKQEEEIIRYVSAKLWLFLSVNSINPVDEDIIEYINHHILKLSLISSW